MGLLRLGLALTVMLAHFYVLPMAYGPIAVCCFFVISGFYMQLVFSESVPTVRDFYISRAMRIYPAFWLFAILDYCVTPHILLSPIQIFSTVAIFGRDLLCLRDDCAMPVVPAWSIAIELMFYVLVPFIIQWSTHKLVVVAGGSLVLNIYIMQVFAKGQMGFLVDAIFPADLWFFLIGVLAFRFYRKCEMGTLASLAVGMAIVGWNIPFYYFLPLLVAACLPGLFRLCGNYSWDRWLGNLSYPIYLSHTVIGAVLISAGETNAIIICLYIFAISAAAHELLEKPINAIRHKIGRKQRVDFSCLLAGSPVE